jgi:hypothetical protein
VCANLRQSIKQPLVGNTGCDFEFQDIMAWAPLEKLSHNSRLNAKQLNSLLFMCRVNSCKANYRHRTDDDDDDDDGDDDDGNGDDVFWFVKNYT